MAQRCTDVASRRLYGEVLTTAATKRNIGVIEALLKSPSEFELEALTKTLDSICAWGNEKTLQLVLKHDRKKVLGIQQYSSGLTQAARKNNRQIVMYWLEEHPEHHKIILDPETVIDVSGDGFMDILPPLIKKIKSANSFNKTLSQCLQVASRNGHKGVIEYLIGESADVNSFVEEARYTGDLDDVKVLPEEVRRISEPDDDAGLEQARYISARNGRLNYNLHHDKSRSTRKLSALQAALIGFKRFSPETQSEYQPQSWKGADAISQQESIEILLAKGADPNAADDYERYPLNIAAAYCPVEIVQGLILSGAHAEAATKEHGTALQAAVRRETGGLPIIEVLLKACALEPSGEPGKVAALNEALSFFETSGRSKLDHTSSIKDVLSTGPGAAVKILLANLPQERADGSRYGLLAQMACRVGDKECVELLLQRGMDVNSSGHYYGTALQAASRVGNIEMVEHLLSSGANVNIVQGAYGTAVRAAAYGGHEDIVRFLIAHGADVNLRCVDNIKPILDLALELRNHTIFKNLLIAGADIGTHILVAACGHGDTDLVELLLASSVDVNASGAKNTHLAGFSPFLYNDRSYEKATPLIAACAGGHLCVIRLLLEHGADVETTDGSSATPLIAAIRANKQSAIRLLLDASADVNHAVYFTPLTEAAADCKLEIVKELLHAGAIIAGPSIQGNALARACRSSQHMVAELLLEALSGNQYEAEACSEALFAAIEHNDEKIVRLLLERGVYLSFDMLRYACAIGVLDVVRMLVDERIDVNQDDGDDGPLLHVAASHSRPGIVQFLIGRGANVSLRSTKYGSPLIAALEGSMTAFLRSPSQPQSCRSLANQLPRFRLCHEHIRFRDMQSQHKLGYRVISDCEQIVRSLLDAGAEADTHIRLFGNALHLASYMGSEVIVRQLLERTEDPNIFGGYFGSPLIAGLRGDHPIIVELLLDRGIEVNHCSPEHGFALHSACVQGNTKLVQSLLDHGADVNAYNDKHGSALAAAATPPRTNLFGWCRDTIASEEQRAIVESLLRHESKVQIRECDLLAAASWEHSQYSSDGQYFMSLFFSHDPSVVATEAVIVKAIQSFESIFTSRGETLALCLEHDGGLGTTTAMLKAAKNVSAMEMLLKQEPVCQVTADALCSAAKQDSRLVKLLLTHDPKAPVTEAAIMAAMEDKYSSVSGEPVLKILLDCSRELRITDEMFPRRQSKDHYSKAALVSQLLRYDNSVKITPPVVHAAFRQHPETQSFLRTLFEHDPALDITREDLMALIIELRDECQRETVNVLIEYGKTVEFTDEIRETLDEKFGNQNDEELKRLFYRLERRNT